MLPGTEDHPHARTVLAAALPPDGHAIHAYLFHGPAGSGKREVAREFAAELLAEGSPDPPTRAARVRAGAHPDLTWVAPTARAEMLVDDIDEPVVAAATRTPFEAHAARVRLERADTMNDQAANRMLKTLEEPAAFAHLVLLTDRPGDVLPTIASRCQPVRFDAPPRRGDRRAARAPRRRPRRPRGAARASRSATATRALALAPATARRCAPPPRLRPRGAERRPAGEPWRALLAQAPRAAAGAAREIEGRTPTSRVRAQTRPQAREREGAERGKRAHRRAKTAALDLASSSRACGCATSPASPTACPSSSTTPTGAPSCAADAEGRRPAALRAGVDLVDDTRSA